ncbi:MAG: helix-hairpin-helix domain-containing protein [Owenweeksia sp.]|nr:helix-hairpin-helix domain-containing protein [Owenweeksia sp.]
MGRHLIIVLMCCALSIKGQVPTGELEMELESIAENNQLNQTDLTQLAEELQALRQNPVEVNFATAEDLQKIPYLNVFQVNNLVQYRYRTGLIFSRYELMAIKGFDQESIVKILPYLSFATQREVPSLKARNIWKYSRHDVIGRYAQVLQKRDGFKELPQKDYRGTPQFMYLRYRGTYKDLLSLGLVAQQDPGEPWGGPFQKTGVDHLSGHVAITNYGPLKKLIVGDFQAEFAQGLALWTGITFGKSAEAVEVKRYARGFRPFTGSEENRFFRGAAATYRFWERLDVSAFYSNNRLDANRDVGDTGHAIVTSLQTTGLHRTENELEDKDANRLRTVGGNINYRGRGYSVGATAVNYQLELPLQRDNQLYRAYVFSGQRLTNYSLDANYLYRDLNIFGELATDDQNHLAFNIGLQSNPADGLYLTLLHRQFDKAYRTLFNAPFAENGSYGESGTYLGLQWEINPVLKLKSYVDLYQFDWLRFRTDAPSRGYEIQGQLEMYFNRYFTAYLRSRYEENQINAPAETTLQKLSVRQRTNLRVHFDYRLASHLKAASRIEYAFYGQEAQSDRGLVLFQDITYSPPEKRLSFSTRFALIDVEDYDARIYAYERDVLYAFSIPPYYGKALRTYLLASYELTDDMKIQARYSLTSFSDSEVISSGNQEIQGNQISEVKVQVRWGF